MILQGKLYRIMTEDVNRADILSIVSSQFDGFTLVSQTGYWRGKPEASLSIEIITDDSTKVYDVAKNIQVANHQESVLVETIANQAELVGM